MGDFNAVINILCKHTKNQSDYTTTQIKQAKSEVRGVRIPRVKFRAGSNELNEEEGKLAEVEPESDEGKSEEQEPNNGPKGLEGHKFRCIIIHEAAVRRDVHYTSTKVLGHQSLYFALPNNKFFTQV